MTKPVVYFNYCPLRPKIGMSVLLLGISGHPNSLKGEVVRTSPVVSFKVEYTEPKQVVTDIVTENTHYVRAEEIPQHTGQTSPNGA